MTDDRSRQQAQPGQAGQVPNPGDSRTVVQEHLQNEDHEISEQDIANVQVGVSSEPTFVGSEVASRFQGDEERDNISTDEDNDQKPPHHPPNPWDVVG